MNYNDQIEEIVNVLYKHKFINEIEYLNTTNTENTEDLKKSSEEGESRLDTLKYILSKIEHDTTNTKENIYDEIDKYMYTKPWNKLKPDHKIEKLIEYVNHRFKNSELKKQLIDDFTEVVRHSKKLNSNKSVVYDYDKQKILYLKALQFTKNRELKIV